MASTNASESTSTRVALEELRALLGKNIQGNVRLFNRITALAQQASKELSADPGSRNLPKSDELLSRWLELNLSYYSLLSEHGLALFDDLVTAAENTLGLKTTTAAEPAKAPARLEINQSGRVGETLVAPFVIENQHPSSLQASFQAGDLVSVKGQSVSSDCIRFEPQTVTLEPKEQAIVKSIVNITSDFEVGETYATTINVIGFQAREILFLITILPELKVDKAPRKASKTKPRAARTKTSRKNSPK